MEELARLAPYGAGNPEPLIGARGLFPINPTVVGSNHLKLRLGSSGYALDAIGFAQGEALADLSPSIRIDAVFTPTFNEWNGNKTLQLNVKAIRPSNF
jgi:single-stranded-DNA-specific exonuclease